MDRGWVTLDSINMQIFLMENPSVVTGLTYMTSGENKNEYCEREERKHGQTLGWSFERVESKKTRLKKVHHGEEM
ncbi:hypothetical protein KQX54_004238 [Cotesia glomerata]|uniref:Uncharacterized protein n=1 Tax=Cotesia glomerata TaxID=32391 RepID=A0AAV7I6S9_COTGL|nr:hypothetical protein KQX54_004238 [Cotesia glomerata]